MFNFDYILGNKIPKLRSDECQKCQNRICCVVYDICSTRNQGRESTIVKPSNVRCEHLSDTGQCAIYDMRELYPGFNENCIGYTCDNIGPLLSEWLERNNISLISSPSIGLLLRLMQGFVTKGNRYNERYKFLQTVILRRYFNSENLMQLFIERHAIESNFQEWANENPEDEVFHANIISFRRHDKD